MRSGIWFVATTRVIFLNWNLTYETLKTGTGSVLLISLLGSFSLFCLTSLITLVLLIWIWMCLFLWENNLLRCWDCRSVLNLIRPLTLSPLLKLPSRNLEPWFILWSLFLPKLLFISINLQYGLAWSTIAMSGLVLLASTWMGEIIYRDRYLGLLLKHLLPLLNS